MERRLACGVSPSKKGWTTMRRGLVLGLVAVLSVGALAGCRAEIGGLGDMTPDESAAQAPAAEKGNAPTSATTTPDASAPVSKSNGATVTLLSSLSNGFALEVVRSGDKLVVLRKSYTNGSGGAPSELVAVPAAGGSEIQVVPMQDDEITAFSGADDGSAIVYTTKSALYTTTFGGTPKKLGDFTCHAIVNDATFAYCATIDTTTYKTNIVRVTLASGAKTTILADVGLVGGLAVAGDTLFFTGGTTGDAACRVPIEGGVPAERLVSGIPNAGRILINNGQAYVVGLKVVNDPSGGFIGTISSLSTSEPGTAKVLVQADEIRNIATDGQQIYFTRPGQLDSNGYIPNTGSVGVVPIDGGTVTYPFGLTSLPIGVAASPATGSSPNVYVASGEDGSITGGFVGAGIGGACGNISEFVCNPCTQSCLNNWAPNCYDSGCIPSITSKDDWATCAIHCVSRT
jgi:hypothetical protein